MTSIVRPSEIPSLLVFGAGGHGRVVADAAELENRWPGLLASDRNPALCRGELLPGIRLVVAESVPPELGAVHIAIGNNRWREHEARLWGVEHLVSVLHPSAVVARSGSVGSGCFVAATAVVGPGAELGMAIIVNHGAVVDHDAKVGDFSHIAPRATLGGGVDVGCRVLIGTGAVVLPGIRIADDVVVGAGAVVCGDITEAGTYAGTPARRIA